jgi:predicted acetyltransferase
MNVETLQASTEDKTLIQRMMELYQYDFSEFDGTDLDQHGTLGYPYLDHYWVEVGRHPFIIRVNGQLAGFALVNRHTYISGIDHAVAEFFIMRKYRRHGVGRQVAQALFDRFRGTWEVEVETNNVEAQAFWRAVINDYTAGNYTELPEDFGEWKGPILHFSNA